MFSSYEEEQWDTLPRASRFCWTCMIWRPKRSKHCRVCDRCVPIQDHHCKFLGICIGEGNKRPFVAGLCSLYLFVILYLALVVIKYAYIIGPCHFSTFAVKLLLEFASDSPLVILSVLVSIPVAWYMFWYVILELYGITYNVTVNEAFNRHRYRYLYYPYRFSSGNFGLRYHNPFCKGVVANWIEFLAGGSESESKVS
jgi:hypothetical protein